MIAFIISTDTGISLGVMWAIFGAGAVVILIAAGIYFRVGAIAISLRHTVRNQWTLQDHRYWAKDLESKNPDLKVPTPEKISDTEESIPTPLNANEP